MSRPPCKLTQLIVAWLGSEHPDMYNDEYTGYGALDVLWLCGTRRILIYLPGYKSFRVMVSRGGLIRQDSVIWLSPADPDFFSKVEKHLEL